MEVSSENFHEEVDDVLSAVESGDFFTFDCEFSGLGKGTMGIGPFDTPELVYASLRENVHNYLIVQIGISAFERDAASGVWTYRSWSFYLFPRIPPPARSLKNVYAATSAALDTDSLDFLSQQRFDFNKWVRHGVNYLRADAAKSLLAEIQRRFDWATENTTQSQERREPRVPDSFKPKLNRFLKEAAAYLEQKNGTVKSAEKGKEKEGAEDEMEKEDEEPLLLKEVTIEERKILEGVLHARYPRRVYLERVTEVSEGGHKTFCLALRACPTEAAYRGQRERRLARDKREIEAARGFARVMEAIGASGKPLVGHYIGLDLLHSIKAFFADLPISWQAFRTLASGFLPCLFDTKFLASVPRLREALSESGGSHSLGELALATKGKGFPNLSPRPASPRLGYGDDGAGHLHDAGYDSFVTGLVFLRMAYVLAKVGDARESPLPWESLSAYANRFSPGRVRDLAFLSLAPVEEAKLERDHVFYIESSSEAWTNTEIMGLFSPFGNVQIAWLNKTAAFVSLFNKRKAGEATAALIEAKRRLGHRGLTEIRVPATKDGRKAQILSVSLARLQDHNRHREAALNLPPASPAPTPAQAPMDTTQ